MQMRLGKVIVNFLVGLSSDWGDKGSNIVRPVPDHVPLIVPERILGGNKMLPVSIDRGVVFLTWS